MKKALAIIKKTVVWLVVLLAVSMMIFTVVSVTTFNRNDRDLFGYKMYIVNFGQRGGSHHAERGRHHHLYVAGHR